VCGDLRDLVPAYATGPEGPPDPERVRALAVRLVADLLVEE